MMLLSFGLFFFHIYKYSLVKNTADRKKQRGDELLYYFSEHKNVRGITDFGKELCDKFIIIGIVALTGIDKILFIDLAAFTTPLLEHFYGKQRRLYLLKTEVAISTTLNLRMIQVKEIRHNHNRNKISKWIELISNQCMF